MRDDVFVRYIRLPSTVNAVTVIDEDGNYNIYINSNLSREAQQEAYDHELYHIEHGHHYNYTPVSDCEKETKEETRWRGWTK